MYIGAPNIADYSPGPRSYIDIREFQSPEELADKLKQLDANEQEYKVRHTHTHTHTNTHTHTHTHTHRYSCLQLLQSYFTWKSAGLSEAFRERLSECVHYAECRICEYVRKSIAHPATSQADGDIVL